jgi:predicted PurR-regulated permease PerM
MRALVAIASFVVVLAGLKVASPIVVPVLLAVTLAIIFQPLSGRLARRGLPPHLAALITTLAALATLAGAAVLVAKAWAALSPSLPLYEQRLLVLERQAHAWLDAHRLPGLGQSLAGLRIGGAVRALAASVILGAWGLAQVVVSTVLIGILLQLEGQATRAKLARVLGVARAARLTDGILGDVQRYLVVKLLVSLVKGTLLGLWTWAFGLPDPALWGLLAFALNFIPMVGSAIAAAPSTLVALLVSGPGAAAGLIAGYAVVNLVVASLAEPRIIGRALRLSPVVVFTSMLLWGFILGPVGALLSVPLTLTIKLVLADLGLDAASVLLGPDPADGALVAHRAPARTRMAHESGPRLSVWSSRR